jgi:hypothetical protein
MRRVAELSGVHHPLLVLPREAGRAAELLRLPAAEGIALMAQSWSYSSAKARRELGYRARSLDRTLRETIDWYRDLIDGGTLGSGAPSAFSLTAAAVRLAGRTGLLGGVELAERYLGRKLVVRP